jgi:hypothetical protein
MHDEASSCTINQRLDTSVATMNKRNATNNMSKEDRKRIVLSALADIGWAVPPKVLYRNLKLHQNISFEERSIKTYLDEHVEDGYVRKVDPKKMEQREIQDLDENSSSRGWYIITQKGLDRLYS